VAGQLQAPSVLSSGEEPLISTGFEARWIPQLVWTWRLREKLFATTENRALVLQPVITKIIKKPGWERKAGAGGTEGDRSKIWI
jgi:hypothetical protein